MSSPDELFAALRRPFESYDLEWRAMYTKAGSDGKPPLVLVAPYVNRPALVNRLNQVCGIAGWQTDARVSGGHVYVGVGILTSWVVDNVNAVIQFEWVWRWDGTGFLEADPPHFTQSDAGKGDFSNAFKRACELFGIATYLRELKPQRAILDSQGRYKSNIQGHGVQRWNPPALQGSPSYPGEIPDFGLDRAEGGSPTSANGNPEPPNGQLPVDPPAEPVGLNDEQKKARIQELKDRTRDFMNRNGYRLYHLDALIATTKGLRERYSSGEKLGRLGTVDDWELVAGFTERGKTKWDEAQRELAKEFPTGPERLQVLDELLDRVKVAGQELVILNTAKNDGWNDAIEYWIEELGKR